MRGVLVSTVLALGLVGHLGPDGAGAGEPLPEIAAELLAEGFNAPVFLVAPDDEEFCGAFADAREGRCSSGAR